MGEESEIKKIALLITSFNLYDESVIYSSIESYTRQITRFSREIYLFDIFLSCCSKLKNSEIVPKKSNLNIYVSYFSDIRDNNKMILALWEKAIEKEDYDYYLIFDCALTLNENAFSSILELSSFLKNKAIIVGSIYDKNDNIIYGGKDNNEELMQADPVIPIACRLFDDKFLMIPRYVYNKIGLFDNNHKYFFGLYEYALRAKKKAVTIVLAPACFGKIGSDSTIEPLPKLKYPLMDRYKKQLIYHDPELISLYFSYDIMSKGLFSAIKLFILTKLIVSYSLRSKKNQKNVLMNKLKYIIKSLRLRTLPLSISGILVATALAYAEYQIDFLTVLLLFATTISLQILANLANELGDSISGTDNNERLGKRYSIQEGGLNRLDLKCLIGFFSVLSALCGSLMIYSSFGTFFAWQAIFFLILGASAIYAALAYTLGKKPYGYKAKGDFFVFLYFGIVPILGAYYILTHGLYSFLILFPAVSIGLLNVAVLNLNNIRDMKTDAKTRVTIAIKLGQRGARIYQVVLIGCATMMMLVHGLLQNFSAWNYLFLLTVPLLGVHLFKLYTKKDSELDSSLPFLVMTVLLFSILVAMGSISL